MKWLSVGALAWAVLMGSFVQAGKVAAESPVAIQILVEGFSRPGPMLERLRNHVAGILEESEEYRIADSSGNDRETPARDAIRLELKLVKSGSHCALGGRSVRMAKDELLVHMFVPTSCRLPEAEKATERVVATLLGFLPSRRSTLNVKKPVEFEIVDLLAWANPESALRMKTSKPVIEEGEYGLIDIGFSGGWAFVYIDGKKVRTTPLLNYKLAPGKHVVELRDAKKKVIRTWKVKLKVGGKVRLVHED